MSKESLELELIKSLKDLVEGRDGIIKILEQFNTTKDLYAYNWTDGVRRIFSFSDKNLKRWKLVKLRAVIDAIKILDDQIQENKQRLINGK